MKELLPFPKFSHSLEKNLRKMETERELPQLAKKHL